MTVRLLAAFSTLMSVNWTSENKPATLLWKSVRHNKSSTGTCALHTIALTLVFIQKHWNNRHKTDYTDTRHPTQTRDNLHRHHITPAIHSKCLSRERCYICLNIHSRGKAEQSEHKTIPSGVYGSSPNIVVEWSTFLLRISGFGFQISAQTPAILPQVFRNFLPSRQANVGKVS
jgi:hypothetical protein